jgi:prevent-host-death family protein
MPKETMVAASDFKARCLRLLDEVNEHGIELVITKRGQPVAKLVPIGSAKRSMRGAWKTLGSVHGDIVHTDWADEFEAAR